MKGIGHGQLFGLMLVIRKSNSMKLLLSSLLVLSMVACKPPPPTEYTSKHFKVVMLSEGVYACIHKFGGKAICNVGIIDNGKETLIFDTFLSPEVASEIEKVVDHYGLSPIRYVVNSHAHNDHIRGNQVFSPEVDVVATRRTAELIDQWEGEEIPAERENAPAMVAQYDSLMRNYQGDTTDRAYQKLLMWLPYFETLAESHQKVTTRLPNVIVEDSMNFNGPERSVQLRTRGAGHTESDLILYLPDDQILFSADLVFNGMHPYMGQGFPYQWLGYLDYLESLDFNILVPGHGEVCGRKEVIAMKSYLRDIEFLAGEMIREGRGIDQLNELQIPDAYQDWWFEDFFPSNLAFMYHFLERQE